MVRLERGATQYQSTKVCVQGFSFLIDRLMIYFGLVSLVMDAGSLCGLWSTFVFQIQKILEALN